MHLSNRNLYFIHFTFCKSYYLLLLEFVLPSFVGFTYCFPIFNPLAFSQPPWNIFHSPGDKSLTGWIDSHVSFRCRSSFSLTFLSFTPFRRPSSTNAALPLSVTHVLRFACQPSTSSPPLVGPFSNPVFQTHLLLSGIFSGFSLTLSFCVFLSLIFPVHPAENSASSLTFFGGGGNTGCPTPPPHHPREKVSNSDSLALIAIPSCWCAHLANERTFQTHALSSEDSLPAHRSFSFSPCSPDSASISHDRFSGFYLLRVLLKVIRNTLLPDNAVSPRAPSLSCAL